MNVSYISNDVDSTVNVCDVVNRLDIMSDKITAFIRLCFAERASQYNLSN